MSDVARGYISGISCCGYMVMLIGVFWIVEKVISATLRVSEMEVIK